MTRKEKELKVLEVFGLKVGDKIKIEKPKNFYLQSNVLQIVDCKELDGEDYFGCLENGENIPFTIVILFKEDWEKVEPLKDKKCEDFDHCNGCPFIKYHIGCMNYNKNKTLKEIYIEAYNKTTQDLDKLKTEIYGEEK